MDDPGGTSRSPPSRRSRARRSKTLFPAGVPFLAPSGLEEIVPDAERFRSVSGSRPESKEASVSVSHSGIRCPSRPGEPSPPGRGWPGEIRRLCRLIRAFRSGLREEIDKNGGSLYCLSGGLLGRGGWSPLGPKA